MGEALILNRWPIGDIRGSKSRLESQSLVESMHPRVGAAALHQHMMTIYRPGLHQRGLDDGPAVSLSLEFRMGGDVLQEAVAPSLAQQIRRGDEHAGRRDAQAVVGH